MTADLIVDAAQPADSAQLTEMMAALQDFEGTLDPNRLPGADCAADHVAALLDWSGETGGAALIARSSRRVIAGFLIFGVETEFGHFVLPENQRVGQLSDIYVVPEWRRMGVARRLIEAAEARLAAAGVHRAEVSALVANVAAISAYEAAGYRPSYVTCAKALLVSR